MKLARINTVLLGLIIVINGYLLIMPFYPRLVYWWQNHTHSPVSTSALNKRIVDTSGDDIPSENRLVVPSMHLNDQIFEGKDLSVLRNGPWRLPYTSTPDKGGNTVIVGHRYTYTNPRGTFYSLDRVQIGDRIGIFWQHKKYVYRVASVQTVKPDAVSVEAPTTDSRLTLYTCTPLWLPKDRLVVTANLESTP